MSSQVKKIDKFEYAGVNHIALVTDDMAATVKFYTEVLEMPLVKSIELPDGRGQHFFFDIGVGTIAFFWYGENLNRKTEPVDYKAPAGFSHLSISVPLEKFYASVDRLKEKGVDFYVMHHEDTNRHKGEDINDKTWILSMYFRDNNGIQLEFSSFTRDWDESDLGVYGRDKTGKAAGVSKRHLEPAE
jgi:catechol 2,3-dioxygenase-like lactoylglutathione lyase family enzyme